MTDQFTGRAVNVDTLEIVKLLTAEIENFRAGRYADVHPLTVEYLAAHDRPPCPRGPATKAALIGQR